MKTETVEKIDLKPKVNQQLTPPVAFFDDSFNSGCNKTSAGNFPEAILLLVDPLPTPLPTVTSSGWSEPRS